MQAMLFDGPGRPLRPATVTTPTPGPEQVLLCVHACGICRTDLHIVDGELKDPRLPRPPGGPLLCAGLIGYRCLTMAGDAEHLGLYGFGAAAHIVAQVARWQGPFPRCGCARGGWRSGLKT